MTNSLLVPLGVVTVTWTVPVPGGEVAPMRVSERTAKEGAGVAPKRTAVAPVNPLPSTVTLAPPAVEPAAGETELTVGAEEARGRASDTGVECAEPDSRVPSGKASPRPVAGERGRGGALDKMRGPGQGKDGPCPGWCANTGGTAQAVDGLEWVRCRAR